MWIIAHTWFLTVLHFAFRDIEQSHVAVCVQKALPQVDFQIPLSSQEDHCVWDQLPSSPQQLPAAATEWKGGNRNDAPVPLPSTSLL